MLSISEITTIVATTLKIAHWHDSIEIIFISTVLYYFLLWLREDRQKNLIYIFYGYCILAFCSYYSHLPTMSHFLFSCAPIMLIFFIILHQNTLQKNFVTLKRAHKVAEEHVSWFEELTRACLGALNNNKEFICVIERNDQLQGLIEAPCVCYADLKKDIFDIFLEKHKCTPPSMVWINQSGKLVGINATWQLRFGEEWITPQATTIAQWKQDGIVITAKTDALIFKVTPLTRTFDLIIQGKLVEDLTADQAFTILQHHVAPLKQTGNSKQANGENHHFQTRTKNKPEQATF
jgi:hypothetical protein